MVIGILNAGVSICLLLKDCDTDSVIKQVYKSVPKGILVTGTIVPKDGFDEIRLVFVDESHATEIAESLRIFYGLSKPKGVILQSCPK